MYTPFYFCTAGRSTPEAGNGGVRAIEPDLPTFLPRRGIGRVYPGILCCEMSLFSRGRRYTETEGKNMAQVTVTIGGVSRAAVFSWHQEMKPLVDMGGGSFATAFESPAGVFLYSIVLFGSPNDPWTGVVTDGTTTHNHAGHMSPGGNDTTGDTAFGVS